MLADHIDEIIMLAAGAWMTLVGFGYLQLPTGNGATPPWARTLAGHFNWMGPLLVAIALLLAIFG